MLENSEHRYVVELTGLQGQRLSNVLTDELPLSNVAVPHLIVHPDAVGNSFGGKIQKRRIPAATQIADAASLANMREGGAEAHACDEVVQRGVGHLFEVVVADVRAAADAEHAQEKRSKDNLQSQEQTHGPQKDLPNLRQGAESAGHPLPGNPSATRQPGKK